MTGEEYWNLKRGDTITVETPFYKYQKGQVFRVEYINDSSREIYIRDVSGPLGSQIDIISILMLLDNFITGGKLPEKRNNKVPELPFEIGDKAWFITSNEVHEGTIIKCDISIDKEGIQIYYDALLTSKYNCATEATKIASNELFNTKKELLESL